MKATKVRKGWALVKIKTGRITFVDVDSQTKAAVIRCYGCGPDEVVRRVEIREIPKRQDTMESRLKKMLLDAERDCNCHKDSNGTLKCPVHSSKPRRKKR